MTPAAKSELDAEFEKATDSPAEIAKTPLPVLERKIEDRLLELQIHFETLRPFLLPPEPDVRQLSEVIEKALKAAWMIYATAKGLMSKRDDLTSYLFRFQEPMERLRQALAEYLRMSTPRGIGPLEGRVDDWMAAQYDAEPAAVFTAASQPEGTSVCGKLFQNAHSAALDFAFSVALSGPHPVLASDATSDDIKQAWHQLDSQIDEGFTCAQYDELLTRIGIERAVVLREQHSRQVAGNDKLSVAVQYVTLDQCAAFVNRSKRTLERMKTRKKDPLPDPDVPGGGGKADEWKWKTIRTWLERNYGRQLPSEYPRS